MLIALLVQPVAVDCEGGCAVHSAHRWRLVLEILSLLADRMRRYFRATPIPCRTSMSTSSSGRRYKLPGHVVHATGDRPSAQEAEWRQAPSSSGLLRRSIAADGVATAPPGGGRSDTDGRLPEFIEEHTAGPEGVVRFYNGRGTAEQWIEGKYALNWTRLACHRFVANRVRLSRSVLAYNLGNFLRRLCLPKAVKHWSLRVQVKLIKMGGRLVRHSRWLIFQLSEVSVPRRLFQGVLDRIGRLSPATS